MEIKEARMKLKIRNSMITIAGSVILAFGLYHIHSLSGVTEGGVLGMTLLLEHWFGISPALSGFVMNILCYCLGWKLMGKEFLGYTVLATVGFSATYKICELFPPLWSELAGLPLVAALLGALFVGVGAGLCVRIGGAPSGDDALAMSLAALTKCKIQWAYLITDLIVLALSLTYIPVKRIGFSVLTVILSGQLIGFVQKVKLPRKGQKNATAK